MDSYTGDTSGFEVEFILSEYSLDYLQPFYKDIQKQKFEFTVRTPRCEITEKGININIQKETWGISDSEIWERISGSDIEEYINKQPDPDVFYFTIVSKPNPS